MGFKSNLFKGLVAGSVVVTLSTVAWNGQDSLDNIKSMYNDLFSNYSISLGNISTYKKVLQDKQQELKDLDTIRTNLLNENKTQATRIGELEAQIKTLQEQGTTDSTEIERLEAELQALQTEYENTQADLNDLIADYNRVVAELEKANAAVAQLEDEIEAKDATITDSVVLTEQQIIDEIGGEVIQKIHLTFSVAEKSYLKASDSTVTKVIEVLNNMEMLDDKRESPVLLHFDQYNKAYMSSETAFNKMSASAKVVYSNIDANIGELYKVEGGSANYLYIKVSESKTITINYNPNAWINELGYAELDN